MLSTPAGRPASVTISGSSAADSGAHTSTCSTTVQPAASAGATARACARNGARQEVITPATPSGRRSVLPSRASSAGRSVGGAVMTSAARRKELAACATCSLACAAGSPEPSISSSTSWPALEPMPDAIRSRIAARAAAGIRGHVPAVATMRAASTAWWMSAAMPTSTRVHSLPVAGSGTPNVFAYVPRASCPPTKCLMVSGTTIPPVPGRYWVADRLMTYLPRFVGVSGGL
jgi:hypothetical protein